MINDSTARQALGTAALALVVALACTAAFLPPMAAQTLASLPRAVLVGAGLAVALLLHWTFLGRGAQRMGRPAAGWVALSLLLFPIGSVTALVLLGLSSPAPHAPATVPGA